MVAVAALLLTLSGLALAGIGGFFVFPRPALLHEDARFMGTTRVVLLKASPGLERWLTRVFVFWMMGGCIAATGVLVAYLAITDVRAGVGGALVVLAGSAT